MIEEVVQTAYIYLLRARRLIGIMSRDLNRWINVVEFVMSMLCCTAARRTLTYVNMLMSSIYQISLKRPRTLRSTCSGVAWAYILVIILWTASSSPLSKRMRAFIHRRKSATGEILDGWRSTNGIQEGRIGKWLVFLRERFLIRPSISNHQTYFQNQHLFRMQWPIYTSQ
jgi:hypothetical protein